MSARFPKSAEETARIGPKDETVGKDSHSTLSITIVRDLRLLLIAIWLGAAVFFSFAVAPAAFAVLPTREFAGALVSLTLESINAGGLAISLVLLATAFLFRGAVARRAFLVETISLVLIAISTFVGKWVIASEMQTLRTAMGRPIDEVAQTDPLRIAFNSLHGYSVVALTIAMVASIVALLLIARRTGK